MKMIYFTLLLQVSLLSCVSTQYRKPVDLTQKEISSMKVFDRHHVQMPVGPGKIKDCDSMHKYFNVAECAIILCKENQSAETKLDCEIYIPESVDAKQGKDALIGFASYVNQSELTQIKNHVKDYNDGNFNKLTAYCNQDHVSCYLNSKFFPDNKPASSFNSELILHRSSHKLKNNSKVEITVFGKN